MFKAYKYRIYPNEEQKVLFSKTFGCTRFVYNWALNIKKEYYNKYKKFLPYKDIQNRMVNELKVENTWLKEVNSQSLICSIKNLEVAYNKFFKEKGVKYPKFKNKKGYQSFQCPQHCKVDFSKNVIIIPKAGSINAVLHRKFNGEIKTVTISMTKSGKYYASVLVKNSVEEKLPITPNIEKAVGLDLGIKNLVVCSNGMVFENNKDLNKSLKRLAILQRRLSKKKKDSSNWNKACKKVAILHEKISNRRKDYLHKITYRLTHDKQVNTICIEDLNVRGMLANRRLSRSIIDSSFRTFRHMLEYKCKWYGVNLIKVNRFAPTSKTCSNCGYVYKGLKLKERSWTCPDCGTIHDRDFNASINIRNFGFNSPTLGARGC